MGSMALLLVLPITGCSDRPPPTAYVERWDSAGTEIVAYASLPPTGSIEIAAQPELWIRGDERIPPFDGIWAVAILADGSVVLADRGANQIHAFAPDASYLWSAGRSGEGPGEFRLIGALFVDPGDRILAVDGRLARITVLSADGVLIEDHRLVPEIGTPVGLLANGELLYQRQRRTGEASVGVQPTLATWSAADVEGTTERTLTTTPGSTSYYGLAGGRNVIVAPDFLRHAHVAVVPEGYAVTLSDEPRIDFRGMQGELLRSLRLPAAVLSTPIDDEQAVRDALFRGVSEPMLGPLRELAAAMPIPERWPSIGTMLVDDGGSLWVQQYRPAGVQASTWYVFGSDGAFVGEVTTPIEFTPMVIRRGRIAGVWEDEMDVQSVRVYRVQVSGGGG